MAVAERDQLRQWAARGAEQRLLEIARETEAIYRAFPNLRQNGAGRSVQATEQSTSPAPRGNGRRGRHMRSAAARRAARERMLKYWAERRKANGNQAAAAKKEKTGAGKKTASARASRRGRRKMSAAARKRIGDAQRARWAKVKAARGKAA